MKKIFTLIVLVLVTISPLFSQSPSYVPQNGLVAYYPFTGNANDESGNGNNLITNGSPSFTSNASSNTNSAALFPNGNDYYTTPTSSWSLINNFSNGTVSFWVKINSAYVSNHYFGIGNSFIVKQKHGCCADLFFGMLDGTTKLRFGVHNSFPNSTDLIGNTSLIPNNWYHVIGTWDGITVKLYVNGVIDNTLTSNVGMSNMTNPSFFSIGSCAYGGNGSTNFPSGTYGALDDIGIWNRALSAAEIQNLYNGCSLSYSFPQDTIFSCGADSVLVDAGAGWASYAWSNGDNTQSIYADASGTYNVTVTNASGCSAEDSVYVSLINAQIEQNDTTICLGGSLQIGTNASNIGYTATNPFTNPNQIYSIPSGVYWYATSTDTFQIQVDSDVDGGGWILALNYVHLGGTNPALNILTDKTPLLNSETLGNDESASTTTWGHIDNALFSELNPGEARFYGITSGHSRVMHFKSNSSSMLSYFGSGTGSISGLNNSANYTLLAGHTAYLPVSTANYFTNQGDLAMTNFPFWLAGTYHWGIKGLGDRWEVDDYPNNGSKNTIHQIWVRAGVNAPVTPAQNYSIDWSTGDTTETINVSPTQTTTYHVTITDGVGSCIDSVTVTVNTPSTGTDIQTACDTYNWIDGVTYTASTSSPTFTLTNVGGCDSVVTLSLTINNSILTQMDTLAVSQYTWPLNGITYTLPGTYSDTLTSVSGCDSVVSLILTIMPPLTLDVCATDSVICEGSAITLSVALNQNVMSPSQLEIGYYHDGGIIAYLFQPGDLGYVVGETHGIIITEQDIASKLTWGPGYSIAEHAAFYASLSDDIGTGLLNTQRVLFIADSLGVTFPAVQATEDYSSGCFDDWFLPSAFDLEQIRSNVALNGIGSFKTTPTPTQFETAYWSSSFMANYAGALAPFMSGGTCGCALFESYWVRPVRYF